MSVDPQDGSYPDEDGPEPWCVICGGEGWVDGADIASSYDYGWIDENKHAYPVVAQDSLP